MVQGGIIIHIEVCDHLIITLDGFYPFSEKGLLQEIKGSKKFVPLYQEKERIRKEALKIGKLEGLREGKQIGLDRGIKKGKKEGKKEGISEGAKAKALEMAKKMRQKGNQLKKSRNIRGCQMNRLRSCKAANFQISKLHHVFPIAQNFYISTKRPSISAVTFPGDWL